MDPSFSGSWGHSGPPPPSAPSSPPSAAGPVPLPGGSLYLGPSLLGAPGLEELFPTIITMPGTLESPVRSAFGQPPHLDAVITRKRKAPTLRDSDWELMKARIVQLYVQDKLTLPQVTQSINLEFNLQPHRTYVHVRIPGSLAPPRTGTESTDIVPECGSFGPESKNGGWTRTTSPTNPCSCHENSIPDEPTNQKKRNTSSGCGDRLCHLGRTSGTSPGCKPPWSNPPSLHSQFLVSQSKQHWKFWPTNLMLLATPSGMSYWTGSPASFASSPVPATSQAGDGLGSIPASPSVSTPRLLATSGIAQQSPAPIPGTYTFN